MEKTNEILTIAGKRVRVVYDERNNYSCDGCCFAKEHSCQGLLETGKWPCEKYGVSSAYFVPAEEIANKPQTDANKNAICALLAFPLLKTLAGSSIL